MSRQQRIREWMATQDGPRTSREIAEGIGEPALKTQWSVAQMYEDGMLDRRSAGGKSYAYWMVRDAMTKAETLAVCGAARDARNAGLQPQRQLERQTRMAAIAAEREARRNTAARRREAARKLYEAKRNERRKLERARLRVKPQPLRVVAPKPAPDPQPQVAFQSVADFLANGGQVEVLPGPQFKPRWAA